MSNSPAIPKLIHYCWFGNREISELGKRCIDSWCRYLPEYELVEWNENNFEVESIPFTKEAYIRGEFAFVSDYVRFWALYKYGGLYFDTDVEIIKPVDHIIACGPFMGAEHKNPMKGINPGLAMGAFPGMSVYKEVIDLFNSYTNDLWRKPKSEFTVVKVTTDVLIGHGLRNTKDIQTVNGINIYPQEFFCPMYYGSEMSENTVSIHYFEGSWLNRWGKIKKYFRSKMPSRLITIFYRFKYKD